ncbi:MAG: malectin domain-containing carbohydrate-binding protein, partial [Planctomycetota bacterium]
GDPSWTTDGAFTNAGPANSTAYGSPGNINVSDPSIPDGTPSQLFGTERYDSPSGQQMQWDFAVDPGNYEVRLYFAETFSPTFGVGKRVFDVDIEGERLLDNYDIFADVGANTAVMKSFVVNADTNIDIDFTHVTQNPAIEAIEILTAGSTPNLLVAREASLDFGPQNVGQPQTLGLPVSNAGSQGDPTITIDPSQMSIVGAAAGQFRVINTQPLVLAPGQEGTVNISYTPAAVGPAAASLRVPHSGDNSPLTFELTGTGVDIASTASVFVNVDPGSSLLTASTFGLGSFDITNNSTSGQKIASVRFDIESAMLHDVVFDPNGGAGDLTAKGFSPDAGANQVGLTGHSFGKPEDGGFQVLEIAFDDFDPGETFSFSVDIDPSNIKGSGSPGPSHSGSISGLELSGSGVSVTLEGGATLTSELFRKPSSGTGGVATLKANAPAAPTLAIVGQPTTPVELSSPTQTLRITATPGSTVRLLQAESALYLAGVPNGGFDVEPFEPNTVTGVSEQTIVVGPSGTIDIPVTPQKSSDEGGYNHFLAVATAGAQTSEVAQLLVTFEPTPSQNAAPVLDAIANQTLTVGETKVITITGSDPNGDGIAIASSNLPSYATLADLGDGSASLTLSPTAGDVGVQSLIITATDDGTPALADQIAVQVTVAPEIIRPVDGDVLYRVNAGGPALGGNPGWASDNAFTNLGAAQSFTNSTNSAINLTDPSLPDYVTESIFQSERWDNRGGQEMAWDFDVAAGTYEVRLYFAEIHAP